MASVLILSNHEEGIPLALRFSQEGHITKLWIKENGISLLPKEIKNPTIISDPTRFIEQFDLVICTSPYLGEIAERCKDKGKVTYGGVFNDRLQLDEEYGNAVVGTLLKTPIGLPEGVEVPISVTGWFNGSEFILKYYSFTYDKFMEHNKGYDINMGCITILAKEEDKIFKETLEPLIPLLTKVNYLGPITMESVCFFTDKVFLGFNTYLHSSFYSLLELIKGSTFDLFWKISQKNNTLQLRTDEVSISCNLSLPPYPFKELEVTDTENFVSIAEPAKNHAFLLPLTKGYIGTITARGEGIAEARRRLYRTLNNSILNNTVQYRSDIGYSYEDKILALRKWGWLE